MRILTHFPLLLSICAFPAFSEEKHDHDHDHHAADVAHADEPSNLIEQLGFGMVAAEDRLIAGRSVTALPVSALFHEAGKTFVLTQDESEPQNFTRWEVQLGKSEGGFVEARTGVFPGDHVITRERPLLSFQPGVNVPSAKPSPVSPSRSPERSVKSAGGFGIQIGAYSREDNAKRVADQLKPTFGRADVLLSQSKGKPLYRVRVGEYQTMSSAKDSTEKLKVSGYPGAFVVGLN